MTSRLPGRGTLWLVGFGVWTLLALLVALQNALFLRSIGEPFAWGPLLLNRAADWYTCAIFTPAYFYLVRRYPIDRQHWARHLALFLIATLVFVAIKYAIYLPIARALSGGRPMTYVGLLARNLVFENIAFWCLLGVVHAIVFYERYRERESQAAELSARLAAAQLEALSGQLHPHFLFNTLQGVSTLIHRDPPAADQMLTRLSELLRRTLQRGQRQEVPLAEELEMLSNYVAIMQVRFGDRLTFTTDIEPGTESALVPHFILQPLVENALQHGIGRRSGAGTVLVRSERQWEMLRLIVRDDGAGPSPAGESNGTQGIGLRNTRLRLEQLYGERQQVVLEPISGGGMEVRLEFPLRSGGPA